MKHNSHNQSSVTVNFIVPEYTELTTTDLGMSVEMQEQRSLGYQELHIQEQENNRHIYTTAFLVHDIINGVREYVHSFSNPAVEAV